MEIFQENPFALLPRKDVRSFLEEIHTAATPFTKQRIESIAKIAANLNSPVLQNLCDARMLTLGLIKPHAYEGKNLPEDDDAAAEKILEEIGRERVVLKIPFLLKKEQAEEFYLPRKSKYDRLLSSKGITLWDKNIQFIISGPLTFLLIYLNFVQTSAKALRGACKKNDEGPSL